MYDSITTYRRGDLVIDVLPGRSHSAAWVAVTTGVAPTSERPLQIGARAGRRGSACAGRRHRPRRGDLVGVSR